MLISSRSRASCAVRSGLHERQRRQQKSRVCCGVRTRVRKAQMRQRDRYGHPGNERAVKVPMQLYVDVDADFAAPEFCKLCTRVMYVQINVCRERL